MTTATSERPTALTVTSDNIPAELKEREQWGVWKYELLLRKRFASIGAAAWTASASCSARKFRPAAQG